MPFSRPHRRLLMVHAHPDDECISTGGTLARYSAAGARTVLVTCTRGDLGPICEPGLATRENLAEVRARELADAACELGVSRVVQLDYRDSGMAGTEANLHPASFHRADLEQAAGRVVRVIREERPRVVVTYDENGGYGHPDHVNAHRVAVAAFRAAGNPARYPEAGPPWAPRKLYYAVFPRAWARGFVQALRSRGIDAPDSAPAGAAAADGAPEFGTPDHLVTTAVRVQPFVPLKKAALAAHRTQVGTQHFMMRMPLDLARELWAYEYYLCAIGAPSTRNGELEDDLFAGE